MYVAPPASRRLRPGAAGKYEEYHPYGSTAWWAGDAATVSQKRYRYTGMERDEETGLQCHGVRSYAPWLGRWTSADPIGLEDGLNRYAYVHGDPIAGRDRNGLRDEHSIPKEAARLTAPEVRTLPKELQYASVSSAFPTYISKMFVEHYLYGQGRDLVLGAEALLDTNPLLDVTWRPDASSPSPLLQAAEGVRERGGGVLHVSNWRQASASLTNGTLGNATAIYDGTLTVTAEGDWEFQGTVYYEDFWDFDPKLADFLSGAANREWPAEAKVILGGLALLGGDPFWVRSEPIEMQQTGNLDRNTSTGAMPAVDPTFEPEVIGDDTSDAGAVVGDVAGGTDALLLLAQ